MRKKCGDLAVLIMRNISKEIPLGYFLGKLTFIADHNYSRDNGYSVDVKVIKRKETYAFSYILCQGKASKNNGDTVHISFSLVKNKNDQKIEKDENYIICLEKCNDRFSVSKQEIESYCTAAGDENSIHKGENPVVPGILLLLKTEECLASLKREVIKELEISWHKPVYINQEICLHESGKGIAGFFEGKKCFEIKNIRRSSNE